MIPTDVAFRLPPDTKKLLVHTGWDVATAIDVFYNAPDKLRHLGLGGLAVNRRLWDGIADRHSAFRPAPAGFTALFFFAARKFALKLTLRRSFSRESGC